MMVDLEKNIGYSFKNHDYLIVAMTHKSYYHEKKDLLATHNEKFEFLGDAVLDLTLSEILFMNFPKDSEGNLSKKRASLVNEDTLSMIASQLKIADFLLLGKGESQTGGLQKPRLLASAYEALVGAVYIDSGFDQAKELIREHFKQIIENMNGESTDFIRDYKTRLQELTQKKFKVAPVYELVSEEGPAHERIFHVQLVLQEKIVSKAQGKSKKQAEQEAAKIALEVLDEK